MLGILYGNREFFLQTTPINLFFTLALLFINLPALDKGVARAALLAFLLGMLVEILGVNYGLIFGEYAYGENLGVKVFGVPLLIGANWAMLSFITGSMAALFFSGRKIVAAIAGAVLMVLLDLVIEPVAPLFDYWEFSNPVAPLSNYVGWFLVALPIQLGYQYWVVDKEYTFSAHLVLIHFLFFGVFALL
jgi:putative membrane protein